MNRGRRGSGHVRRMPRRHVHGVAALRRRKIIFHNLLQLPKDWNKIAKVIHDWNNDWNSDWNSDDELMTQRFLEGRGARYSN